MVMALQQKPGGTTDLNDWISHCVLKCEQALKPPEVFEQPSYCSLPTDCIIDLQYSQYLDLKLLHLQHISGTGLVFRVYVCI